MANLDFFGTSKMTVTKSQNRLRSFGAETRAEVPARRNSSKYVTLKIYNHALQNLRREALYPFRRGNRKYISIGVRKNLQKKFRSRRSLVARVHTSRRRIYVIFGVTKFWR